jgi:hypothetical protein
MAVQAECSLRSPAHGYSRERMLTALYGCVALVDVAVGVLGLLGAAGPRHFQWFLATGLFALIIVRVLTLRLWRRSVERTAPSKEAAGIDANRVSKRS